MARTGGFSLHAGIAARAHQREKLERLCRYIARPAVVTERLSLTRFHGVFAPNSRYRTQITPAARGRRRKGDPARTEPQQRQAMTWAQRLKRVFRIDIEICKHCGSLPATSAGDPH